MTTPDTDRKQTAQWTAHRDQLADCPHSAARHAIHHEAQRLARRHRTQTQTARRLLESL